MNQETLIAVKIALEKKSIYSLFSDVIGIPEEIENENSDRYALMFNVENNELFFLPYATHDNNWAQIAEQQNPWIKIGSVNATDILMGNPASEIADRLDYEFENESRIQTLK